ncbi:hypothetical protein CEXT_291931 [Caerostris extrusa]|uniref:Uncharacterized protein n=1 Tax=Caerostris extrusa TaxID=172846 RepID=A0AAV4WXL4_CAEEX|nr:hypothetical protein CEXT_291931 [Caerostris extrusa]
MRHIITPDIQLGLCAATTSFKMMMFDENRDKLFIGCQIFLYTAHKFAVLNSVLEEVHDCLHTQVPPPPTPPTKRCHHRVPRALICSSSVSLFMHAYPPPPPPPPQPRNPETGRRARDHTTPGSSGHDGRWRWQRAGVALLLQLSWEESLR